MKSDLGAHLSCYLLLVITVFLLAPYAASVAVPSSKCYAFDNSSHIHDFSSWIGQLFQYEGKDSDIAVRFCKDVESRSQQVLPNAWKAMNNIDTGYVDFGRYDNLNYFVAGSGHNDLVQEYHNGDLMNCEHTYEKMGRTAQVNIICGSCPHGTCKGELGCICSVIYESTCRVLVDLAIHCGKPGPRVFQGFTVGFHPRSWELVYNGLTQLGYEKSYHEYSFKTEHTNVALYMTAISSLSRLVQKPAIKIFPENGLEVRLSGSGAAGNPPTTLSPTILMMNWRCEKARETPYEVEITIPVEGYESVHFTLTKMCDYTQRDGGNSVKGWATFGIITIILLVTSTLFFCGGFVYNTRWKNQRGIEALPGMSILSACLETVSGGGQTYTQSDDSNRPFVNQVSWERPPASSQGTSGNKERKYGAL